MYDVRCRKYSLLMKISLVSISSMYALALVCFCYYWSSDFLIHTIHKGDEFIMLVQFLLVLSYLYYLLLQFTISRINFLLVLSIPLISCLAAFCIGIFLLMLTGLSGTPKHYILTYGLLYGTIILLSVFRLWGQQLKNDQHV